MHMVILLLDFDKEEKSFDNSIDICHETPRRENDAPKKSSVLQVL